MVEAVRREGAQRVWIVGGAVRDALLGRAVSDWDLLCTEPASVASEVARRTAGRLVTLHETPATYRVVLEPRTPRARFLDFTGFRGATLEEDLAARDLTLNALAAELPDGALLDPHGGLRDLRAGCLRALSAQTLEADPVRCLRAYRFASELGFAIHEQTRSAIRDLAPQLSRAPGERLGPELLKLLRPTRAAETLELMAEDGVLWQLVPELQAAQGVLQGGFHHRDVWGHTLEAVANMERLLASPERALPGHSEAVREYLARPDRAALLLLAALLHDVAKPACLLDDGSGRRRFLGHDREGSHVAGKVAARLALRGELREALKRLVRHHLRPVLLANEALPHADRPPAPVTMGALRRLFRDVEPEGVGLLLLALADVQGCQGPAVAPGYHEAVAHALGDMLARYRRWQEETAERPLLSGADLIAAGYEPGRAFGQVLRAVDEARADGLVSTAEEALALAHDMLESSRRHAGQTESGDEAGTNHS
jgi:poly(A) polymerase